MEKKFRLESILNLREHVLKNERDKLIYLKNIKDELLDRKKQINYTIKENVNELEILKNKGMFEYVSIYENYIANMNLKIEEIDRCLKKIDIEIERQMNIVMQANKDKKIMEKLKENHKDSYESYQKYIENKLIDEVNTIRYNGKNQ